jgi:hypothetical protein
VLTVSFYLHEAAAIGGLAGTRRRRHPREQDSNSYGPSWPSSQSQVLRHNEVRHRGRFPRGPRAVRGTGPRESCPSRYPRRVNGHLGEPWAAQGGHTVGMVQELNRRAICKSLSPAGTRPSRTAADHQTTPADRFSYPEKLTAAPTRRSLGPARYMGRGCRARRRPSTAQGSRAGTSCSREFHRTSRNSAEPYPDPLSCRRYQPTAVNQESWADPITAVNTPTPIAAHPTVALLRYFATMSLLTFRQTLRYA